jgi:septal ring factor EnvC (AmiA/AmiB activator)
VLQVANAGLVAARDSALEEAAAAADETKRLAAEVARLKDELAETQEQLSNAKVCVQDYTYLLLAHYCHHQQICWFLPWKGLHSNCLLFICCCSVLQEVAAQDMEQWQGQLEAFKKQLHVEKQQGEAAVELAAARLTIAEGQELEARCQEVRRAERVAACVTPFQML